MLFDPSRIHPDHGLGKAMSCRCGTRFRAHDRLRGVSSDGVCNQHQEGITECPAYTAIGILQEKWVLHIVHALLGGARGFNELGREVGGCNPTTLAQRLTRLEDLGIVTKQTVTDAPIRSSYSLTAEGEGLSAVIGAIQAWASRHLESEAATDAVSQTGSQTGYESGSETVS